MAPVQIIGSYLSPYVRKVLVCLHVKGIPYEIDPIVPFFGDDRFARLSPVRRIPVLIDAHVTLADSSVICQYLEDRHPAPALFPQDVTARARARWLEEYADTRLGDVFIWWIFETFSIADAAIAVFFRNAAFARFTVDAVRWPRTAGFVARTLAHEAFQALAPFEERMIRTPLAQHRDALRAMGAPIMEETYGTTTPRRGVMAI